MKRYWFLWVLVKVADCVGFWRNKYKDYILIFLKKSFVIWMGFDEKLRIFKAFEEIYGFDEKFMILNGFQWKVTDFQWFWRFFEEKLMIWMGFEVKFMIFDEFRWKATDFQWFGRFWWNVNDLDGFWRVSMNSLWFEWVLMKYY